MLHILGSGWAWWTAELRACVPDALIDWLSGRPRAVVVTLEALDSTRAPCLTATEVARALPRDLRGREVVARLPRRFALIRQVTLPASAHAEAGALLEFDLARSTLVDRERVIWRHGLEVGGDTTLQAEQVVLDKRLLGILEEAVFEAGGLLRRVEVASGRPGSHLRFPTVTEHTRPWLSWSSVNVTLFAGTLVAVLVMVVWPYWQDVQRTASLRTDIAELRRQALSLRQSLEAERGARDAHAALQSEVVGRARAVEVLRELTVRLPDTAWLTDVEITATSVRFSGQIDGPAAGQIIALERSPMLRDPRLTGPVSMVAGGTGERFEIAAGLGGARE